MIAKRLFLKTDQMIEPLRSSITQSSDEYAKSRIAGLLCVMACSVYEQAVKEIVTSFAHRKHTVFGVFIKQHTDHLNAKIKKDDLVKLTGNFGEKYANRFKNRIQKLMYAKEGKKSTQAYSEIIDWRHDFVHAGNMTATFEEVVLSYSMGKDIIIALEESMVR